jgi:hypothetical protein
VHSDDIATHIIILKKLARIIETNPGNGVSIGVCQLNLGTIRLVAGGASVK